VAIRHLCYFSESKLHKYCEYDASGKALKKTLGMTKERDLFSNAIKEFAPSSPNMFLKNGKMEPKPSRPLAPRGRTKGIGN